MNPQTFPRLTCMLSLLLVLQSIFSQSNPEAIVNGVLEKRKMHRSLSYDVRFLHKGFNWDDTVALNAHVELVRVPEDSLFHGMVLIKTDTMWYGYDGEKVFQRSLRTNEVIYDNAATSPGLFVMARLRNNLIDDGFLINRASLLEVIKDPQYECRFSDEFIGRYCLGMTFRLPDDGELVQKIVFGAIDTMEHYIIKKTYSSYFQGNEQYQEWNYYNIHYGQDSTIQGLDWSMYGPNVKETQYFRHDENENQVPDVDWLSMEGKIFNSEERIRLKDIHSQYIILDFWYTSCYPCIQSIPMVCNIARKYDRKNVAVYGANMIDNEIKHKSQLDKFFVKHPMPYPTIMLENDRYAHLNLSYPTFIILNDKFEVVFYEAGYNENLETEVTDFLDNRLQR